jgi:hypothetical protein
MFIKTKVFDVNWFQWHQNIQHLFRGALYAEIKCKKRAVQLELKFPAQIQLLIGAEI